MTRLLRDFRIIPVVLIAISALFVLKSFGLVFDGGYTLVDLWRDADDGDVTGTVPPRAEGRRPRLPLSKYRRRRSDPGLNRFSTIPT